VSVSTKHIVVALRMAGIAGQDKLNGIFEYLSEGHRWSLSIYRSRHEFTAETVRHELSRGADGFIVGIPQVEDALSELSRHDVPVVIMNIPPGALARRPGGFILIKSDSRAIGQAAANALLSQGIYRGYGYVGYRQDEDWSRERGAHFRSALRAAGFGCETFELSRLRGEADDKRLLEKWLKSLPRPCGILAACDDSAYEIIDICRETGIRIPREIGLVGVNNDPLLCENTEPKLSSIQPDFKREGYLAARAIANPPRDPETRVGIRQIVHRESTRPLSNSGKLVQKALAVIRRDAARKLSVADVAARLRVSRSLLDLRFRELQGSTVRDAIVSARIDEIKRRLRSTEDSIEDISRQCGWTNVNSLKNHFRKATGTTMRDWRKAAQPTSSYDLGSPE